MYVIYKYSNSLVNKVADSTILCSGLFSYNGTILHMTTYMYAIQNVEPLLD